MAAVRIEVEFPEGGCVLRLVFGDGSQPLRVESALDRTKLAEQRAGLAADLDFFRTTIGPELSVNKWSDVDSAMFRLNRRGKKLLFDLFGSHLPEVQWRFTKNCSGWDQDGLSERPLIEVVAGIEEIVPIEYLPLFNPKQPPRIVDLATLAAAARPFLGFSTHVRRVLRRVTSPEGGYLENEPTLGVKFFHYAHDGISPLNAVALETRFFRDIGPGIDLDGPWPDRSLTNTEFARVLTNHLFGISRRFDGCEKPFPDHVHHFSCHCESGEAPSESHKLILAPAGNAGVPPLEVSIGRIKECIVEVLTNPAWRQPRTFPLVFMNACGSGHVRPQGVGSFPHLFLERHRHHGFIGTETAIPDRLAAEFSARFYTRFLGGEPLAQALHEAKWDLLRRFNNPMGIIYVAYVHPGLRVRKPIRRIRGRVSLG
jgi:hypothetical protein